MQTTSQNLFMFIPIILTERNKRHTSFHPCRRHSSIHKPLPTLPIHVIHLDPFQINPIERPHVHRHHIGKIRAQHTRDTLALLEEIHNRHPACRTEGVSAYFAPEAVYGQVGTAAEGDVAFGGVDPEVGVLWVVGFGVIV